ncbi:MAG TPA: uracil-DNA glycosylase family protein [Stellaceae bacterium]|nr:uracil-DNA glycosylase family protein [Stellaceae bacterium]
MPALCRRAAARPTSRLPRAATARLLIISQAPGTRAHASGLSFDDRSGDRLREWLGIGREMFYDEIRVAAMPMGFCYPGRAARGGDRPPSRRCAPLWHRRLQPHFGAVELTLFVGSYAIRHYLPQARGTTMTATLRRWREFLPGCFVLPHPSWRVEIWQRANPWFAAELLPELRRRVTELTGPRDL